MPELYENYFSRLKTAIDNLNRDEIDNFINILNYAKENGKNIFIMGNGGSAATASHFCCDFNKGMSCNQDKRFKLICLNDNVATMLAYANDVSYDDVFVEQLKNFLTKDDIVIGISGSGNSKNVLKAIEYANIIGATTFGMVGFNGGMLKKIANHSIHVNINDMQITEDIHMMLCHMLYSITMNKDANIEKELIYE